MMDIMVEVLILGLNWQWYLEQEVHETQKHERLEVGEFKKHNASTIEGTFTWNKKQNKEYKMDQEL